MFSGFLILIPLLLIVSAALAVIVGLAVSARPDHTLSRELVSARRHGVTTALVAVALQGLGLALAPASFSPNLPAVMPLVGSALALLALLVGELTWPRPRGTTRTAVIRDRSVGSLLRGGWARTAGVAAALLVFTLVVGGLLGNSSSSDAAIATVDVQPDGSMVERASGPFPGWAYGVPQLVVLVAVVGLLLLALRATTDRATVVTADLETDHLLRRASAARAFRTATFGILVTAGADLFFGGSAARNVHDGVAGVVALGVMLLGLGCLLAALVIVLVPAPRLPRTPVPVPADQVST
ncbi:MAG: hypothetical protein ACXWXO_00070 [Nocardioides sp.]